MCVLGVLNAIFGIYIVCPVFLSCPFGPGCHLCLVGPFLPCVSYLCICLQINWFQMHSLLHIFQ